MDLKVNNFNTQAFHGFKNNCDKKIWDELPKETIESLKIIENNFKDYTDFDYIIRKNGTPYIIDKKNNKIYTNVGNAKVLDNTHGKIDFEVDEITLDSGTKTYVSCDAKTSWGADIIKDVLNNYDNKYFKIAMFAELLKDTQDKQTNRKKDFNVQA